MADIWMDVDVALAEVPVNLLPLIDDTDFKTREVAIAYNQAGMDLVWNFVTTAGAMTQTAVTPTTAGVYDWAHQGDGIYTIEIPASGGASINNDTEGFGWFTGYCTGVLPWRGPVIGFRAAALNDALIDGGDNLDVNTVQWLGTACATPTVAGVPEVDVTHIEGGTQTVSDLKDFADAGYDPATNKVQGVVLVDTCTANTDMRGTDSASLASVCTEVRLSELDAATAGKMANQVDEIRTDTEDIQTKIGVAGAGLTGIPWNAAWDAEVQSECADALVAYDPPTKAELDTAQGAVTLANGAHGGAAASITLADYTNFQGAAGSDRLLMIDTTIATLASQTSFTLTAGSADDNAYRNCTVVIEDVSTSAQKAIGVCSAYIGSTKTVTLKYDPGVFTMAITDKVYILAENSLKSTEANRQLDVTAAGKINGVVLVDTTTTNTDMRGTDSAALASALTTAQNDLDILTGVDGVTLATAQANYAPAKVSDLGVVQTADHTAAIADIPTVAEFNARTLLSADYVVATDTIAGVTTVTNLTNAPTNGDLTATMKASVNAEADTALADYDAPTKAELDSAFTEIKGATWSSLTDTLEHIRDKETDIETDTAEIGIAGAGLTNINLPDQTMNIVGNITGNLSGSVGSVTGHTPQTADHTANIAAILTDTGTTLENHLTDIKGTGFAKDTHSLPQCLTATGFSTLTTAQVNAEVVDALNVDTYAEPGQGVPPATATLMQKIGYLYKLMRNKITQTATETKVYNDAEDTVDQKATVSDDATTYTRGEFGSGP